MDRISTTSRSREFLGREPRFIAEFVCSYRNFLQKRRKNDKGTCRGGSLRTSSCYSRISLEPGVLASRDFENRYVGYCGI